MKSPCLNCIIHLAGNDKNNQSCLHCKDRQDYVLSLGTYARDTDTGRPAGWKPIVTRLPAVVSKPAEVKEVKPESLDLIQNACQTAGITVDALHDPKRKKDPAVVRARRRILPALSAANMSTKEKAACLGLSINGVYAMQKREKKRATDKGRLDLKPGQVVHIHQHQPAGCTTGANLIINMDALDPAGVETLTARLVNAAAREKVSVNALALGLLEVGLQRYAAAGH